MLVEKCREEQTESSPFRIRYLQFLVRIGDKHGKDRRRKRYTKLKRLRCFAPRIDGRKIGFTYMDPA
jgi:hypothetical protein